MVIAGEASSFVDGGKHDMGELRFLQLHFDLLCKVANGWCRYVELAMMICLLLLVLLNDNKL